MSRWRHEHDVFALRVICCTKVSRIFEVVRDNARTFDLSHVAGCVILTNTKSKPQCLSETDLKRC